MTVQDAGAGGSRPLRPWAAALVKFSRVAGHYSLRFLAVALVLGVAFQVSGGQHSASTASHVLEWANFTAWTAWFLSSFADSRHQEHLCERCIAATPLDPQAAIRRWDWALRWHHRTWLGLLPIAAAAGLFFWVGSVRYPAWWMILLTALASGLLGAYILAEHRHRMLYPWCPYCRWGEGGEHEAVPDPDPAAGVSR